MFRFLVGLLVSLIMVHCHASKIRVSFVSSVNYSNRSFIAASKGFMNLN